MIDIFDLLQFTVENGASDLHLSAGSVPMVRMHGKLQKLDMESMTDADLREAIYTILTQDQIERLEEMKEIDLSQRLEDKARFRVNVFEQMQGIAVVFRVIPSEIMSFEELGLPEVLRELSLRDRGLILLTGPTGSGKSTTLATMVDNVNENKNLHIITIEDPVEFFHESKNCMVNQRELGATTHSFANALRSALREDPDVILVGEMRDLETISLALTAAETGHLVLATLHTSSAAKTIDRIIDTFPASQKTQVRSMLAESLEAVVSQKLLPKKDGMGRAVATEIMVCTVAVRNLIREDKIYQLTSVIQSSSKDGMHTLDQDLQRLLHQGLIDRETAAYVAENSKLFDVDLSS